MLNGACGELVEAMRRSCNAFRSNRSPLHYPCEHDTARPAACASHV